MYGVAIDIPSLTNLSMYYFGVSAAALSALALLWTHQGLKLAYLFTVRKHKLMQNNNLHSLSCDPETTLLVCLHWDPHCQKSHLLGIVK